jgi:hypothetical protein
MRYYLNLDIPDTIKGIVMLASKYEEIFEKRAKEKNEGVYEAVARTVRRHYFTRDGELVCRLGRNTTPTGRGRG